MFQVPMSSPKMTRMFGLLPAAGDEALARTAAGSARASNTFLAASFGQKRDLSAPRPASPVPAPSCRDGGIAPWARDAGPESLLAATRPRTVPTPTQANARIVPTFMAPNSRRDVRGRNEPPPIPKPLRVVPLHRTFSWRLHSRAIETQPHGLGFF